MTLYNCAVFFWPAGPFADGCAELTQHSNYMSNYILFIAALSLQIEHVGSDHGRIIGKMCISREHLVSNGQGVESINHEATAPCYELWALVRKKGETNDSEKSSTLPPEY